jgi:hypothetical protein
MPRSIEVSDDLYERLQSLAGQLFTVEEVIERLLKGTPRPSAGARPAPVTQAVLASPTNQADLNILRRRTPRQRGATVEIAGQQITANTVPDLYAQVLQLVLSKGLAEKLNSIVPYPTSNERYLISRKPKHPNGNDFFSPVHVNSYYLEAHKNYETALKHLARLLGKLGLDLRYIA